MDINCGCFGTPEKLTGMTIVRDGALSALAVLMTVFAFLRGPKAASLVCSRESLS